MQLNVIKLNTNYINITQLLKRIYERIIVKIN